MGRQRRLDPPVIRPPCMAAADRVSDLVLRTDLIPTKGSKLCQDEFGTASLNNSGSAHACQ